MSAVVPGDRRLSASGTTGRGEAEGRLFDSSSWLKKGGLECEVLHGGDVGECWMVDGSRLFEMSTSRFRLAWTRNGSEMDR